jgi:glycosidase
LVNLNFKNNEVQQWILEACKYWVRKFNIDGYRFDAMWAVNARAPLLAKDYSRN